MKYILITLLLSTALALTACPSDDRSRNDNRSAPPPQVTRIATAEDLQHISDDGTYLLTADITVTGRWTSIAYFRGNLDGGHHVIRGLGDSLFIIIAKDATVTNLGILDSDLAYINSGQISYTYATNYSLVSHNYGTIYNSYAIDGDTLCDFFPKADAYVCGGLVDFNKGTIYNSYATRDVSCTGRDTRYCGGLVSYNEGTIENSYATGDISCRNSVSHHCGGLVAYNEGTIRNTYTTDNFLVNNHAEGTIGHSYATRSLRRTGSGTISDSDIRTLDQLQCPSDSPDGDPVLTCAGATTYDGWSSNIWIFGNDNTLPRLADAPFCPPSARACRW